MHPFTFMIVLRAVQQQRQPQLHLHPHPRPPVAPALLQAWR